jgi:hypothetical protein
VAEPAIIEPAQGPDIADMTGDPIVQAMAAEVAAASPEVRAALIPNGRPTLDFMNFANAQYRERGGTGGGLIGTIAYAIVQLLPAAPDAANTSAAEPTP